MEGIVLALKLCTGDVQNFFLNTPVTMHLFIMLGEGAEAAGWLGEDGKLLPKTDLN